jgi:type IV pilus assembly protein PilX
MHQRFLPGRPPLIAAQRGITLIIAMLMLVVIGIMSVAIMRNATSSDQVANNSRLQAQANQAAQMAIRFCEDQLQAWATNSGSKVPPISTQPIPAAWTVKANWMPSGKAYTLAKADVGGGDVNFPTVAPQCVSEVTGNSTIFTITARGFSNDYRADSNGATTSGAVVWLQSTVYMP